MSDECLKSVEKFDLSTGIEDTIFLLPSKVIRRCERYNAMYSKR